VNILYPVSLLWVHWHLEIVGAVSECADDLLNYGWWRDHRSLQQPFEFLLAFLVGCALAGSDFVESAPLRLHPHVGVAGEHGTRDVPGDAHDHLAAGARLREFRYQGVAVIVPSPLHARFLADLNPRRLERLRSASLRDYTALHLPPPRKLEANALQKPRPARAASSASKPEHRDREILDIKAAAPMNGDSGE
jgi:hypothetical protein